MTIRASATIAPPVAPYDIVARCGVDLVLGPLLAAQARRRIPPALRVGTSPVDLHLRALEALGAEIEIAPAM
jgi:UDP-N-acetylglucosamine 1-carboxyvinyltransferase